MSYGGIASWSGLIVQQCLNRRTKLQVDFDTYKEDQQQSVKKLGGVSAHEAYHKTWLKERSLDDVFAADWQYYCQVGTFVRVNKEIEEQVVDANGDTKAISLLDQFYAFIGENVDNICAGKHLYAIMRNVCYADKLMRVHYSQTMEPARYRIVWWEVMKTLLPTKLEGHRHFFVEDYQPTKLDLIVQKMMNGKRVEIKQKVKAKGKSANAKKTLRKDNKKSAANKKCPKNNTNAKKVPAEEQTEQTEQPENPENDETLDQAEEAEAEQDQLDQGDQCESKTSKTEAVAPVVLMEQDAETLREMKYLDDWSWVSDQATRMMLAKGYEPDVRLKSDLASTCRASLHLLFGGAPFEWENTSFEFWSALKKSMFLYIKKNADECVEERAASAIDAATCSAIVEADIRSVKVLELRKFAEEVVVSDPSSLFFVQSYRRINENTKARLAKANMSTISLRDILKIALQELDAVYKREWVALLVKFLDMMDKDDEQSELNQEEEEELEDDQGDEDKPAPRDAEDEICGGPDDEFQMCSKQTMAMIFPGGPAENDGNAGEVSVNTHAVLECVQVRAKFLFQVLQDVLWTTRFASRRALAECGSKFTVLLSERDAEFGSMNSRLDFWTSLWGSLPSALTPDELEASINDSSAIAEGRQPQRPMELAPQVPATDAGNAGNASEAAPVSLVSVNSDANKLAMMRLLADTPKSLTKIEQVHILLELKYLIQSHFVRAYLESQRDTDILTDGAQLYVDPAATSVDYVPSSHYQFRYKN